MIDASITVGVAKAALNAPLHLIDSELQAKLRDSFPGIAIVVCSEDDILPNLPSAVENERCRLFYLDTSQHCASLSCDADAASGIVVALRTED